jgi:hypothetical protein
VRIPDVQHNLGATNGQLGAALLGAPLGAVIAVPCAGWLVARFGSRPVTIGGALATCLTLPLPAAATSLAALAAALVLLGMSYGCQDMAMNAQAVAVEGVYGRPLMSSFHAAFSTGGIIGAFVGGAVAARGVEPLPALVGASLVFACILIAACPSLLRTPPAERSRVESPFARPSRAILGLGAFAFCALLSEGAIGDWSAVLLRSLDVGADVAAAGFGVFSLTMALGRLAGDRLAVQLGPEQLARLGGATAALGLGLGLIIGQPAAIVAGLAATGAGLSTLFPLAVSAAGRTPGMPPSTAIAAVTTVGYAGLLAGPPMIGGAAQLVTLHVALGLVVLLCAAAALLAPSVRTGAGSAGF